jgi:hypothetical protein
MNDLTPGVCGPRLTDVALFICWRPRLHGGPHVTCTATPALTSEAKFGVHVALLDSDGFPVEVNPLLDQQPVNIAVANFVEFNHL